MTPGHHTAHDVAEPTVLLRCTVRHNSNVLSCSPLQPPSRLKRLLHPSVHRIRLYSELLDERIPLSVTTHALR